VLEEHDLALVHHAIEADRRKDDRELLGSAPAHTKLQERSPDRDLIRAGRLGDGLVCPLAPALSIPGAPPNE